MTTARRDALTSSPLVTHSRAMLAPTTRWGWTRYLLVSAAAIAAVLLFAFDFLPRSPPSPRPAPPRRPSFGRVTIPTVPRDSDARFDDAIIALRAERPTSDTVGCWRLHTEGADAANADRVECRLRADGVHLFEVRHPQGEPELWRITIPAENGESVLVH